MYVSGNAACDLVPGDLLIVAAGDRTCADTRLIAGTVEADMPGRPSQPMAR